MAETVFTPELVQRVKEFQKAHGLVEDGIVSQKTWTTLAETDTEKASAILSVSEEPATSDGSAPDDRAPVDETTYPILFKLANSCTTEEDALNYLREECGIDFEEIRKNVESVLGSAS